MIWLNRRGYCHGTDGSPEECFVNPRVVVNHVVNPLHVLYVQRKKYSKIVVYNKNNDTANNVKRQECKIVILLTKEMFEELDMVR